MKILSIDTSNDSTSVSILEDKKSIGKIFLNCGLIHSKIIFQIVESILKLSSFDIKKIDLVSVCNGPGSFTGIRIGLSLAKGISFSLNKPCIGVSSLMSLAYSVESLNNTQVIYSCIKANNDEIYFNSYDLDSESKIKKIGNDKFVKLSDLADFVKKEKKRVIFVGNASEFCYNKLGRYCVCGCEFYTRELDSDYVGQAACDIFRGGNFKNNLEANYLKGSRAEKSKKEL